jgi:hypothetical protein
MFTEKLGGTADRIFHGALGSISTRRSKAVAKKYSNESPGERTHAN